MKFSRSFLFSPLIVFLVFARLATPHAQTAQNGPQSQSPTAPVAGSRIIYVSDFELDVANPKTAQKPAPRPSSPSAAGTTSSTRAPRRAPASSVSKGSTSSGASSEETPADRANALLNAVSENLIRALTQAGYDARRLPTDSPLPKLGLRIRGVFAEADEQNRVRRLLIGGEPLSPGMLLFVGVNNLAQPEQQLYELANPPANDPRHGPVITVTSYAPMARYEMSRNPSGEELQKIAAQVAADLTALVNVNRLSPTQ